MELSRFTALAGLLVATLSAGTTGAIFWNKNRTLGITLIVGSALFGLGFFVALAQVDWGQTEEAVHVSSVGPTTPGFSFEVPHTRIEASGDLYRFRTKVEDREVLDALRAAYPDGVVDGSRFTVINAGVRYTVTSEGGGVWTASNETAVVTGDGLLTTIAFPRGAVPDELLTIGEATALATDVTEVLAEFERLGYPVSADGSLKVPSDAGVWVTLRFEGATVTASVD